MGNKIIPYRKDLRLRSRTLRKNQTETEVLLWEKLRKRRLGVQFHRQVPLLDYIVDFYCHEIGLAIEIDGPIHETQVLEDGLRSSRLEKWGVHFLRFKNDDVYTEIDVVIDKISERVGECLR